jgi:hypothetical protein
MLYCAEFLSRVPFPITTHFGHLALWILANSGDHRYYELILPALVCVLDHAKDEEMEPFFQEAVLDKGLSFRMVRLFHLLLGYQGNLDHYLKYIIHLINLTSIYCISVFDAIAEKPPQTFMQYVQMAAQRQICHGIEDKDTNGILGGCLSVIRYALPLTWKH